MKHSIPLGVCILLLSHLPAHGAEPVDFDRQIRPILANTCFQCHGPDAKQRKAKLRLDLPEGAFADLGDIKVIEPGQPDRSELYVRIAASEPERRMPPASAKMQLSPAQIELIRRWIEQGAKWNRHWAFTPPSPAPLPRVQRHSWVRNPVDAFVLARLEKEGLSPSPEADRITLIRRVTQDLTGLPPTPEEVDAFLADRAPDAYERVVDRLLASPRYGERMAIPWLDAARYADTSGYQSDGERYMWRWRDWVIEALNANKPFDQFTVEQLAGDLLPGATLEQRIATGFNRNHRGNAEGGIIPEEYAVEYVVDRVETTSAVWLGLTLGCARCHDHKYDPFSQREFYSLFAYFNNVPEHGRAIKIGNSPPYIKAPTRQQQAQLQMLDAELARASRKMEQLEPHFRASLARWEKSKPESVPDWAPTESLLLHYPLDGNLNNQQAKSSSTSSATKVKFAEGRLGKAIEFDGDCFVEMGNVGSFDFFDKFSMSAWIYPLGDQGGMILSKMTDTDRADGYNFRLHKGKLQVNLVKRWLDDALRVETRTSLLPDRWHHVLFTYDGSRVAAGVQIYIDGEKTPIDVLLDELNQTFTTKEPFRIGGGGGPGGRFHGLIDDVRVFGKVIEPDDAAVLAVPQTIEEILTIAPPSRTVNQARKLERCFLERYAPRAIQSAHHRAGRAEARRAALWESIPTCMVMVEMAEPRPTFVLQRGQYDQPGERVTPGVPGILPPLKDPTKTDRLALAKWVVDPANPLTARVHVNRMWQQFFGEGLVRTPEDFGVQGDRPSHPALLDWLALEFIRNGWNVKAMHRLIVTSATYRQGAKVTPALLARDPDNRLLARAPRFRLSAELLRDQALAVSGLLVEKLGGPSVKPYQPPGLWEELTGSTSYVPDKGVSLYRRSLYTFWKRTVAPPMMATFDGPGREMCSVRRSRTNTPLQALTLLNEVTFTEAARVFAQRVLLEGGRTDQERLRYAYRLATGRTPGEGELQIVQESLEAYRADFRADRESARQLTAVGEHPVDSSLDAVELAAYTTIASMLLNLDEVLTRP